MKWNRASIGVLIHEKLEDNFEVLQEQFAKTKSNIGYFYVDDLLLD